MGRGLSKALRFRILKRDGFRCVYCGATPDEKQLRVDHVIAWANGGTSDEDNLVTACHECNAGKLDAPLEGEPERTFVLLCDTCGTVIQPAHLSLAMLTWAADDDFRAYGFRVEHHALHSPLPGREGCYTASHTRRDCHIGTLETFWPTVRHIRELYQLRDDSLPAVLLRVGRALRRAEA